MWLELIFPDLLLGSAASTKRGTNDVFVFFVFFETAVLLKFQGSCGQRHVPNRFFSSTARGLPLIHFSRRGVRVSASMRLCLYRAHEHDAVGARLWSALVSD